MTERLRDQQRAFRVDVIARAAAEVFADLDCRSFTMAKVAERLATSKATLYRYFPSREALIEHVVRERWRDALEQVPEAADPASRAATVARFLAARCLDVPGSGARLCCLVEVECSFLDWGRFDDQLSVKGSPGGTGEIGLARSVRALSGALSARLTAEGRKPSPADVDTIVTILFPDTPGSGS